MKQCLNKASRSAKNKQMNKTYRASVAFSAGQSFHKHSLFYDIITWNRLTRAGKKENIHLESRMHFVFFSISKCSLFAHAKINKSIP